MGDRHGTSDINKISIEISIWDMGYRYGKWYITMVIHHIDMIILDIDMGYGLMIWEMTVSIWSSPISIWHVLSLLNPQRPALRLSSIQPSVCFAHVSSSRSGKSSRQGRTLLHFSAQLTAFVWDRGCISRLFRRVIRGW